MTLSWIDQAMLTAWPWLALAIVVLSIVWIAFEVKRAPLLDENEQPIPFPARLRLVEDAIDEIGHEAEIVEWPLPVAPRDGGHDGSYFPGAA